MSDSCDLSDDELVERIERLEALADGCAHCVELRNQLADMLAILAAREAEAA